MTHLLKRLERSRARARSLLLLRSALWSALVACGSYLVLHLVALLWPFLWRLLPAWGWAVLIFAAALTISSVWALLRTPGLLELARRADRDFGLQERVSTALELARAPASAGAEGEMAAALLADAARHAPAIEPQRLVPLRFPRVGWWLVGLASVLVALDVVGPQLFPGSPIESEVASPLNAAERSAAVADLRRTADLLGGEAEERKDPYLGALAQAFDDLGQRVASGALDRAATERELGRLLDHVERAYEGELSPFGRAASEPKSPEAGVPTPPPGTAAQAQGSPAAREPSSPRSAESGTDSSTERDPSSLSDLLGELGRVEASLQRAGSKREANAGRITAVDYAEFGPYITPESLERLKREREEREAQQARAGQPVGAAQEADRGPGDLAGEGVQPLAGESAVPEALGTAATRREQVRLPDSPARAGERVRLERAPDVQFSEVAKGERPSGAAWRARREAEVRREQLGPRERTLASCYFSRDGS